MSEITHFHLLVAMISIAFLCVVIIVKMDRQNDKEIDWIKKKINEIENRFLVYLDFLDEENRKIKRKVKPSKTS